MVAPVSDQQQSAAGHAACWALVGGRPGASVRSGTWSLAMRPRPVGRPRSTPSNKGDRASTAYEVSRVSLQWPVSRPATFLGLVSSTTN